jgi:hypothetical protein
MTVVKRMRHKKGDGSIIEADIGALAKNVEEDTIHRFVTDNEKKAWNEQLTKDGDVSETTVSNLEEIQESFPQPTAKEKQKTLWGKVKKWQQDCLAKFGNYVLTSMITNQHLNSTSNIPTSALVYLMQQAIQQNQNAINVLNTKPKYEQLWVGICSEGDTIKVPQMAKYNLYSIVMSTYPIALWGMRWGTSVLAFEIDANVTNGMRIMSLKMTLDGDSLTHREGKVVMLQYGGNVGEASPAKFSHIYGIPSN